MRLTSTRDAALAVGWQEAVTRNLPPGGGLFVPAALPRWSDVPALLALPWRERSTEILHRLLGDEHPRAEIAAMVEEAVDFAVPLVRLAGEPIFALELFHGPSLAFKDFGARFLAAVLARLRRDRGCLGDHADRPDCRDSSPARMVLTATSGDTGAAVAAAFAGRAGFRVAVLYPLGRISDLQERQLACLGGNVTALAVEGTFDDCQRLAKACFADARLAAELGLVSANSINVARLLAQVLYYFEAAAQLRIVTTGRPAPSTPLVVSVPSGNFGNLCAGLYARALGLPLAGLVAATNANRTVPDYLDSGTYRARPGIATMSNAMDVGDPSNWERIEHLHRHSWQELRHALRWGSLDDAATADALRHLWHHGLAADPHGAVAYGVLRRVLRPGETGIFLATAHPAKFTPSLARLGLDPAMPEPLRTLLDRPLHRETIAADLDRLEARLRRAG